MDWMRVKQKGKNELLGIQNPRLEWDIKKESLKVLFPVLGTMFYITC